MLIHIIFKPQLEARKTLEITEQLLLFFVFTQNLRLDSLTGKRLNNGNK